MVLYLALMIGIGVYYRRKSASVNDFVLGGRGLGAWFTAFAYGTSYFSAVIFVGYAGKFGWNYGVASTWVGIGNAVIGSWLAWKVLGRRTRIMSKHVFAVIANILFQGQGLHWNHLAAFACLIAAVYFVFMK